MDSRQRMQLYRTTHLLHWISAGACFAALALFTITGITLNHANAIGAQPQVTSGTAQVPQALLAKLGKNSDAAETDVAVFIDWAENAFDLTLHGATAEWSAEELYLSAPGPGRDAWVSIDRGTGAAKYESTDRGWVAYFNDLHKGRNTGIVWTIFIDVIAAAVLFFSLTGLVLLWIQAGQRKSTWPLVGGGIVIVVALMILFAH
jgi:uncharacterized protein